MRRARPCCDQYHSLSHAGVPAKHSASLPPFTQARARCTAAAVSATAPHDQHSGQSLMHKKLRSLGLSSCSTGLHAVQCTLPRVPLCACNVQNDTARSCVDKREPNQLAGLTAHSQSDTGGTLLPLPRGSGTESGVPERRKLFRSSTRDVCWHSSFAAFAGIRCGDETQHVVCTVQDQHRVVAAIGRRAHEGLWTARMAVDDLGMQPNCTRR